MTKDRLCGLPGKMHPTLLGMHPILCKGLGFPEPCSCHSTGEAGLSTSSVLSLLALRVGKGSDFLSLGLWSGPSAVFCRTMAPDELPGPALNSVSPAGVTLPLLKGESQFSGALLFLGVTSLSFDLGVANPWSWN